MNILIKGMEMPKSCWGCEFERPTIDHHECCILTKKSYSWGLTKPPSDCPLVEVPDGHWISEPGKIPKCSECGRYSDDADTGDAKYCPFCGARMDKE